jgi:hypothetical protein
VGYHHYIPVTSFFIEVGEVRALSSTAKMFNCTVRLDSSNEFAVIHGFDFGEAELALWQVGEEGCVELVGWLDNLRLNGYSQQLDRSGTETNQGTDRNGSRDTKRTETNHVADEGHSPAEVP